MKVHAVSVRQEILKRVTVEDWIHSLKNSSCWSHNLNLNNLKHKEVHVILTHKISTINITGCGSLTNQIKVSLRYILLFQSFALFSSLIRSTNRICCFRSYWTNDNVCRYEYLKESESATNCKIYQPFRFI